jgi:hypothetical protein
MPRAAQLPDCYEDLPALREARASALDATVPTMRPWACSPLSW